MSNYVSVISVAASRLAELGNWPAYIDAVQSLTSRIPSEGNENAPGFDAGIACALEYIPRDKQKLSAVLHAAYTPEAVEQVRREAVEMLPDSETTWWLAACSICREGGIDQEAFYAQLVTFEGLANDPAARVAAAKAEFEKMTRLFQLVDGVPFGCVDGCMQGAYLAGHAWAVQYNPAYGIFFLGTYLPTLGLEDFPFSDKKDEKGRPMSGPVWGSKQFVKASSFGELSRAIEVVRAKLG
jgi:hypothetical protein